MLGLFAREVARLDCLRELDLLGAGQQRDAADFLKIERKSLTNLLMLCLSRLRLRCGKHHILNDHCLSLHGGTPGNAAVRSSASCVYRDGPSTRQTDNLALLLQLSHNSIGTDAP